MAMLVLIFIIPIMLLYSLMMKDSRARSLNDVSSHISVSLQNLSDIMDETLTSVKSVGYQLCADAVLGDWSFSAQLASQDSSYDAFMLREQISRTLYQYYLSNRYIHSLDVYNPFSNMVFSNRIGSTRQMLRDPEPSAIARIAGPAGREEYQWFLEEEDGQRYLATYFSPYCFNNPSLKLYARISICADILFGRFEQLFPEKQAVLLIRDASGQLYAPFCEDAQSVCQTVSAYGMDQPSGWYELQDGRDTYLTVYCRSSFSPFMTIVYAPISNFNTAITVFDTYFYYFVLCLIVILVIIGVFLYVQVIRPTQIISKKMRQAEQGDLSVRIRFRQRDELGYVGHRFNVLLEKLQNLIQENYETKMLKNEFELKFIQTQLKEHFIYNTLDSIHWIANRHKVPQISGIIFHLAHFFRLTLNHGEDMVTVREAREILECYLTLLNVRMDDSIHFEIRVDPGLEQEKVIKYVFQPIVENAYHHGIRERRGGRILISMSRCADGRLRYQVEDDGVGMTPQRLEQIRYAISHHGTDSDGDCFALINIDRQLRMYFGENYTFEIDSQFSRGTRVTLIFPLGKGDAHAENDHH